MAFRSAARSGGITRRVTGGRLAGCRGYSVLGGTLLALFLLLVAGRQASAQLPDAPAPVAAADPFSAPSNEMAAVEPGWSSSTSDLFGGAHLSAAFLNARLTPRAPRSERREKILIWSAVAADASMRGLDAYSTSIMLGRGCHEMMLPNFIASHPAAISLYGAGVVIVNYLGGRRLGRRRSFMRWLVPAADAAADGPWAIHNLFLGCHERVARSGPEPILPPVQPQPVQPIQPILPQPILPQPIQPPVQPRPIRTPSRPEPILPMPIHSPTQPPSLPIQPIPTPEQVRY